LPILATTLSISVNLDAISWFHVVIGDKIARKHHKLPFTDRGEPHLFKEMVKYWVVFQLAQVLHEYGLKPGFNNKLEGGQVT
jgi:hypothetical protein